MSPEARNVHGPVFCAATPSTVKPDTGEVSLKVTTPVGVLSGIPASETVAVRGMAESGGTIAGDVEVTAILVLAMPPSRTDTVPAP